MGIVSELLLYPVKGAKAMAVDRAHVTTTGLAGDRVFSVLHDGRRANQKQVANLYALGACWRGSDLVLDYPGCDAFTLDTTRSGATLVESRPGAQIGLLDMGDAAANWLSAALGQPLRLVRQQQQRPWRIPLPEFDRVNGVPQDKFVDAAPILLTNASSLDDLNRRLAQPVLMDRFRPNIVVAGLDAYAEDDIACYRFDGLALDRVTVCERCIVTTVDQATGDRGKEPLRTLSTYRRRANDYAGGIVFGMYVATSGAGDIDVGATFTAEAAAGSE